MKSGSTALPPSLRTQGPIPRGLDLRHDAERLSSNKYRWLWVRAFAGTTLDYALRLLASAALTNAR
jgi:hypothetical protein